MLTFELRVLVCPNEDPDPSSKDPLPPFYLKKKVTIPCVFIPNQLDLLFTRSGNNVLSHLFNINATSWNEKEKTLMVFSQIEKWVIKGLSKTYSQEECWEKIREFGWDIQPR